jgi:hypothetical protein
VNTILDIIITIKNKRSETGMVMGEKKKKRQHVGLDFEKKWLKHWSLNQEMKKQIRI